MQTVMINNNKKRILAAILVFLVLIASIGCSTKKYTLRSVDVYVAYGQKLNGSGIVDATLTLGANKLKDGVSVELEYAGRLYRGEVHFPYVFWETEPYIFADSTSMYTEIYGSSDTIHLTFTALVNDIWFESRQVYSSK